MESETKTTEIKFDKITADEAIKKYNTPETLFFVSCSHPDVPYIDTIIDAKVSFVYIGANNWDGNFYGINTDNIEIPTNIKTKYKREEEKNFLDNEKILNDSIINEYLDRYQVVPNIKLESYRSIGWILVPTNYNKISSFVKNNNNLDETSYTTKLNELIEERSDQIISSEINYILKYGYVDNIKYLIRNNLLKVNLYSFNACKKNKKLNDDKNVIYDILLILYLEGHKYDYYSNLHSIEDLYKEYYYEEKQKIENNIEECNMKNKNIYIFYNDIKDKPQFSCSEMSLTGGGGF